MSKQSQVIIGYIKNLAICNSGFVAVQNHLKQIGPQRAEKFLSKFHGMTLAEFKMAVEA